MSDEQRNRLQGFSGREGFTLIEVLVAFTMLALVTIVIQRGIVSVSAATARADDRLAAAFVARSLMTVPLGSGPDSLTTRTGTMNGYAWRIRFEPLDVPLPPAQATNADAVRWQALRMIISVSARTQGRQELAIETIRLVKVSP